MNVSRVIALALVSLLASLALVQPAIGATSNGQVESSASVSNDRPSNGRMKFDKDDDPGRPGTQISTVPDGVVDLDLEWSSDDGNGWQDIVAGRVDIKRPDGSAFGEPIDGSPHDGQGRSRPFRGVAKIPSDSPPGVYTIIFTAKDRGGAETSFNGSFEVLATLAFALDGPSIAFGTGPLSPGSTTHAAPASIGVRNTGNVLLDLRLTSAGLTASGDSASIAPDRLRYSQSSDMASERPLSEAGITDEAFDLSPGVAKRAYLDLHMPTGDEQYIPAAVYTGSIAIGGVVG